VYEPPVDAVELVAPMPRLDLNVGLQTAGWEMYSLFTALSLPNLLAVLDIALSNVGKVVLVSAFPALLAPCVLTLEYLCELRGSWAGLAQPLVHARDVPLLLDDQGPYILGLVRLVSLQFLRSPLVADPSPAARTSSASTSPNSHLTSASSNWSAGL
jgi:nicotinamide N-methyltransferase